MNFALPVALVLAGARHSWVRTSANWMLFRSGDFRRWATEERVGALYRRHREAYGIVRTVQVSPYGRIPAGHITRGI